MRQCKLMDHANIVKRVYSDQGCCTKERFQDSIPRRYLMRGLALGYNIKVKRVVGFEESVSAKPISKRRAKRRG